jgi:hypothetical protein
MTSLLILWASVWVLPGLLFDQRGQIEGYRVLSSESDKNAIIFQ